MRRRDPFLLGWALALAGAAPAAGAEVAVGVDDTVPAASQFAPAEVTIAAGDTVVWNLDSPVQAHDVAAVTEPDTTPWDGFEIKAPAKTGVRTFTEPGRYRYVCRFHSGEENGRRTGMVGTIVVGNPPPPPPPPLSEQPFPNDGGAVAVFEVGGPDTVAPLVRDVRVRTSGRRARVAFRLEEQAHVTLRVLRGRKTVASRRRLVGEGEQRLSSPRLRPGRYRLVVQARDVAGNRSGRVSAMLTIR